MSWEVHHIHAIGALYALQIPCHDTGLWCAAEPVGPCLGAPVGGNEWQGVIYKVRLVSGMGGDSVEALGAF